MAERRASRALRFSTSGRTPARARGRLISIWVVAALVATALVVDAYVHATDAAFYEPSQGGMVSEATLFRVEAIVSGLLAVVVLLRPSPSIFAASLLVAATAVGALVLNTYINVGAIGPLPNLYEPAWGVPGKVFSAYAEGLAVLLSVAGVVLTRGRRRPGWGHRRALIEPPG